MKRLELKKLFLDMNSYTTTPVTICGWVKTIRTSKSLGFIELNDGTTFQNLQVVFEDGKIDNFKDIDKLNVGAALVIEGNVVLTPDAKQPLEIHAIKIDIEGLSSPEYPLQKKRHSVEYLRTVAHLRPRTNTFSAVFRVRSVAAYAIHKFFNENGFVYSHSPIITGSDCEGAGEMFRVTTLNDKNPPLNDKGEVDYSEDFFGKLTSLTVSGQLEAECMAQAFSKVYTFGPTFRAENSNTARHGAEFWMIEPEIAFADLNDNMKLATDMLKFVLSYVLEQCPLEMAFFNEFYDKDKALIERLTALVNSDFGHVTYTEAIEILKKCDEQFDYPVEWGIDLQTEHERYLAEKIFKGPVYLTDYPKEIKSFYMRMNDDNKTVAAMDLLVPGVGELIGGSQREERYDLLVNRMKELNLNCEDYEWYTDLRKYGTTRHAGFGLGFDRLIMYITGVSNIRDVIPFPRTVGYAEF